jgi:hypothetical protein
VSTTVSPAIDLPALARAQKIKILGEGTFAKFDIGLPDCQLLCKVSQPNPRLLVLDSQRRTVFEALHSMAHLGVRAT